MPPPPPPRHFCLSGEPRLIRGPKGKERRAHAPTQTPGRVIIEGNDLKELSASRTTARFASVTPAGSRGPGGLQEGHPHGDTLQPPTHAASPPATPCQRKTRGRRRDIRTERTLTSGLKAEIHLGLGCPHPPRCMQKDTELPHEGGIMDISIM